MHFKLETDYGNWLKHNLFTILFLDCSQNILGRYTRIWEVVYIQWNLVSANKVNTNFRMGRTNQLKTPDPEHETRTGPNGNLDDCSFNCGDIWMSDDTLIYLSL